MQRHMRATDSYYDSNHHSNIFDDDNGNNKPDDDPNNHNNDHADYHAHHDRPGAVRLRTVHCSNRNVHGRGRCPPRL